MKSGIKRVSTVGMSRAEWLERRRKTVGGSDAAAILGLNRYSGPYAVWAEKRGLIPEKEDTEAMRQGRDLEDYVAARFREASGKRVKRIRAMLYNPDYPFAHADVDRWVEGENAGLECKTTSSLNLKRFENGDYPPNWYVQCMHYMMVTGAERWYLAVVVLGKGFYWYTVERNGEEIAALAAQEAEFWRFVEEGKELPSDGLQATTDALYAVRANSDEDVSVALLGRKALIAEYFRQKEMAEYAHLEMERIKQTLIMDLGDASEGTCGDYTVKFRTYERSTVDTKKLMHEHPEIDYSAYYSKKEYKKFEINGGNDYDR